MTLSRTFCYTQPCRGKTVCTDDYLFVYLRSLSHDCPTYAILLLLFNHIPFKYLILIIQQPVKRWRSLPRFCAFSLNYDDA